MKKFIINLKLERNSPTFYYAMVYQGIKFTGISNVSFHAALNECLGSILKRRNSFIKD